MASYPTSVFAPATRSNGQTIDAGHVNDLQAEVTAVEDALINGIATIKFKAVQEPSSNANTLDDYEEGTFTPTLTSAGGAGVPTYTVQSGSYVKVGQHVTVGIRLTISSKGTLPAGNLQIAGFPFANSGSTAVHGFAVPYFTGMTTSVASLGFTLTASDTTGVLFYVAAAGATAAAAVQVSDVSAALDILVCGSYRATA